jgi:hypothetical protein
MARLTLFGFGYTGARIASRLERHGWKIDAIRRDTPADVIRACLAVATHILSTAPPEESGDPILAAYSDQIGAIPWIGYLSSTAVKNAPSPDLEIQLEQNRFGKLIELKGRLI